MKNTFYNPFQLSLLAFFFLFTNCHGCEDCTIEPDLLPFLNAPSTNIIVGEPIAWEYLITSTDNSEGCDILKATASIARILIDLFEDEMDPTGQLTFDNSSNIPSLEAGVSESRIVSPSFDEEGIYLIELTADATNTVAERDENNNTDSGSVDTRASDNIFLYASPAFTEKLSKTAALVVVGDAIPQSITSYKGIPIYHATK
jgi:hypothetical protein